MKASRRLKFQAERYAICEKANQHHSVNVNKKDIPESQVKFLQEELYDCAEQSAKLDERMQGIRDVIGWNKNE